MSSSHLALAMSWWNCVGLFRVGYTVPEVLALGPMSKMQTADVCEAKRKVNDTCRLHTPTQMVPGAHDRKSWCPTTIAPGHYKFVLLQLGLRDATVADCCTLQEVESLLQGVLPRLTLWELVAQLMLQFGVPGPEV